MGNAKNKRQPPVNGNEHILSKQLLKLLMSNRLYSQDQICRWFSAYIKDCPDGFISEEKLLIVFRHFYNEVKASQLTDNVMTTLGIFSEQGRRIDFVRYIVAMNLISVGNVEEKLLLSTMFLLHLTDKTTMDRQSTVSLLDSIASLIGFKRFRDLESVETGSPFQKKVNDIFERQNKDELSVDEFVKALVKEPAVNKLLNTRF